MADTGGIPAFKVCDVETGKIKFPKLQESDYDPRDSESANRGDTYWQQQAQCKTIPSYVSPLPEYAVDLREGGFHQNMFARAVLTAYSNHLPLRLSPDVVWFTIAQGLAHHVNENPERLRSKFVSHEGTEELTVVVDANFGGDEWPRVLTLFESEISQRTLDGVADLVVANFSTSTALSTMCSRVTLMGAMQSYFTYSVMTLCGIPEISLAGTAEDWRSVRERASDLSQYELDWWTEALLPILDEFVRAAAGKPDRDFFQRMVNHRVIGRGSGSYVVYSGWFQGFFPYVKLNDEAEEHVRNPYLGKWKTEIELEKEPRNETEPESGSKRFQMKFWKKRKARKAKSDPRTDTEVGIKQSEIPSGLSSVPFKFDQRATGRGVHDMRFFGGLTCVTQDPDTGTVEPQFGMAVV